ncbi:MAG TPA: sensor domain-containing diguanylate cyclase, partial [Anaerolineales bacterium]|nr:sensor domain-containing diguanylate cyclase [Anaerolineales bacterium]
SFALFRFRLFRLSPIARRMLIDNIGDAMLVCDERGWLVDLNPAAETLLETNAEDAIGAPAEKLLQDFPEVRFLLQTGQSTSMEFEHPGDAQRAFYDARLFPVWRQKNQIGRLIVIQDITTRKLLEQRLRELATSDDLTGLYTRRHFFERGQAELLRARRYQRPLALFMLDVDRFKRVNDTAGHLVGDQVLQEIAALCRQSLRETDLLARYGGEEFVVLLPETDEESAQKSAERLRQLIDERPVKTAAWPVSVTVSVGVAAYSGFEELTFDDLLQRADRALYLSKARGRNRVTIWQANEQALIPKQDGGP